MVASAVICVALVLPFVCSSAINNEVNDVDHPYFIHPKDRQSGGISPRIIGGMEVRPHSYPSQASLIIYAAGTIYFCGGSLLNNQWVLTAAHCLDVKPDYIIVGLGQHNITSVESTAVVMNATRYLWHSGYDGTTFQNDVGLIRLPQNATLNANIKPIEIASGSDKYEGKRATEVGWGETEAESLSSVLKSVNTTVMKNDDCANINAAYKPIIKPMHICASGAGIVGVCSGDSGGPLIVDGVQVGITSFGTVNCTLGMPSVFTRVTEFEDWIWDHAKDGASPRDGLQVALVVLIASILQYFFH